MTTEQKKVGRPTKKTPELIEEICIRLGEGESLRGICEDDHMPDMRSVLRWLASDEDFVVKYTRARELQSNTLVDRMLEKASEYPERHPITGAIDPASVSHIRNQVTTMQWLAMKLNPKKYGDKIDVTSDGKQVGLGIHIDLGDK